MENLESNVRITRAEILQQQKPVDIVLEREIRDRIQGLSTLDVNAKYLAAITGGDLAFVSAVENSPQQFPLINDETRKQGEVAKIEASPLRQKLDRDEAERNRLGVVLRTVRRELKSLMY